MKKNYPRWGIELRDWQEVGFAKWQNSDKENFLVEACPASGKTLLGVRIAHHGLTTGKINKVIVIVPTRPLKKQTAVKYTETEIHLDYEFDHNFGRLASDYDGIITTYQSIASQATLYRSLCDEKTLVILDEIHHGQEGAAWANAIEHAFEFAGRRLLLTGTAFRTDKNKIPYVRYDGDNNLIRDYTYLYGEALLDFTVARPIKFPYYYGEVEVVDGGEIRALSTDVCSEKDERHLLRGLLDPRKKWLGKVMVQANQKLNQLREVDKTAGGLVIAKDIGHAEAIAELMGRHLGIEPIVVHNDIEASADAIKKFDESSDPWIVSVHMVSEGVDIPRLRVLVYATNVRTELYFRQAAGRTMRWMTDIEGSQAAYMYIPQDRLLIEYAERIKDEVESFYAERVERVLENAERISQESFISILSANQAREEGIIYDGVNAGTEALNRIRMAARGITSEDPENLQVFLEKYLELGPVVEIPAVVRDKTEGKTSLKDSINSLVGVIVHLNENHSDPRAWSRIHGKFNKRTKMPIGNDGKRSQAGATDEQLLKKHDLLKEEVKRLKR